MDGDVVVSSCAVRKSSFAIADKTVRPLEVDVLDCRARLLIHDVRERRRRRRYIRYGEVLLHGIAGQEDGEVENLCDRVCPVVWWDFELAVPADIDGNLEEVAALRRERLRLIRSVCRV